MKTKIYLVIIVLLSLFFTLDLFQKGLPITHDGKDHVFRIANFYENLREGIIIPRWAANLNWGYGHPILEFLYPLPSYLASVFHFFGFSFIDSVKTVFVLGVVFSGLAMYLWLRSFLIEEASFLGAFLYMAAPYRFIDLYVRGDIGEHLAFVFVPLVFYSLIKLKKSIKPFYLIAGAVSLSFLILSHNAISLMFIPFVITYALYLIFQSNNKTIIAYYFSLLILLGFGISVFFWAPALLEGKYTLRNIVTEGAYMSRFVDLKSLFYGPWNYGGSGEFTVQFGVVQWVSLLAVSFLAFFKKKKVNFLLIFILFIFSLIAILLMLPQSAFIWSRVLMLQNFQFPWRFLGILVFTTAALGGIFIENLSQKLRLATVIVLIIISLGVSRNYWHANGYFLKPDGFFSGIYSGTTDTGESAPIWSVRFMDKRPKDNLEIIEGKANVKELERNVVKHTYEINAVNKIRARENTLYFPGWNVFVDGIKVNIEFQDPANRGLITFFVDKGKHLIRVEFKETKLRLMANIVSALSLTSLFLYSILKIPISKLWRRSR